MAARCWLPPPARGQYFAADIGSHEPKHGCSSSIGCHGVCRLGGWAGSKRWVDQCCLILLSIMGFKVLVQIQIHSCFQQDLSRFFPNPNPHGFLCFLAEKPWEVWVPLGISQIDRCLAAQLCVRSVPPGTAVAQGAAGRAAEGHATGPAL